MFPELYSSTLEELVRDRQNVCIPPGYYTVIVRHVHSGWVLSYVVFASFPYFSLPQPAFPPYTPVSFSLPPIWQQSTKLCMLDSNDAKHISVIKSHSLQT